MQLPDGQSAGSRGGQVSIAPADISDFASHTMTQLTDEVRSCRSALLGAGPNSSMFGAAAPAQHFSETFAAAFDVCSQGLLGLVSDLESFQGRLRDTVATYAHSDASSEQILLAISRRESGTRFASVALQNQALAAYDAKLGIDPATGADAASAPADPPTPAWAQSGAVQASRPGSAAPAAGSSDSY